MICLTDENYISEYEVGVCEKFLCRFNGSDWLYKYNLRNMPLNFGERIYSDLGQKLKLDVVETHLASAEERKGITDGVMVKWFRRNNETILNFWELNSCLSQLDIKYDENIFTVDGLLNNLGFFAEKMDIKFDRAVAQREFNKRIILDYFLCQIDRNFTNMEICVNNKEIKFTPFFDNSACLSFPNSKWGNVMLLKEMRKGNFAGINNFFHYELPIKNKEQKTNEFLKNFFNSIIELYKQDGDYKKFIESIYKYNLAQNICSLEKENEKPLNCTYKAVAKKVFEHRKKRLSDYVYNTKKTRTNTQGTQKNMLFIEK